MQAARLHTPAIPRVAQADRTSPAPVVVEGPPPRPAAADEARLTVELLGPLRALAGEREIDLGAPKQRAAFAVLALCANTAVSRGELVDRIWGEAIPTTAAGSLHTYVSGLRRALAGAGDPLTGGSSGYLLRLRSDALDLARAERLEARARAAREAGEPQAAIAALDEALALWRTGPPLGALPGPFAAEQRTRLTSMRLRLLVDRTDLIIGGGRAGDLAEAAERLAIEVHAHPYDERLRSVLMTALHRSGRTADALAHYRSLRRLLADELGIEPEAATREAHRAILAQDAAREPRRRAVNGSETATVTLPAPVAAAVPVPAADTPALVPAQLPPDSASFVGRADELRQVIVHARTGDGASPRIMMIVGVGGIGKTTLAVRCGHELRGRYPDGQIYINLRGYDPTQQALTPSAALHQLLASLGIAVIPDGHEQRVALWRSLAASRRMVVLFDNARSAEQVEDLLPGTGSCFVLVTSRNRLGRIAVKYAARRITLAPLPVDDALCLLADAVGTDRVRAEDGAARRLAELCDHSPFALRIAAEQLVSGSDGRIADLVGDLEDVHQRLDTLQLEADELCSVRGVMSWSFAALEADAARAFRLLGAYPGLSITQHCAAALFDLTVSAAGELLRRLSAQHLLEQHGNRFTMHDLTRTYSRELSRALSDAEIHAARDRVSAWYAITMAPMAGGCRERAVPTEPRPRHPPTPFAGQGEFLRWCGEEWPNLNALIHSTARTADHRSTWRLTYLLFDYFYATGPAADWLDLLGVAMRSAEASGDRRARAALLGHRGVAHSRMGRNDLAVDDLRQGLELLDTPEDGTADGEALRIGLLANLASTLREAEDYEAAEPPALEARRLAESGGGAYHRAATDDVLCQLYTETGRWGAAVEHARPGLENARACGSVLLEANLLINLGLAHSGLGQGMAALGCFTRALRISESAGDRYHEGLALLGSARIRAAGGDGRPEHAAAATLARRALMRFRELSAEEAADALSFLGGLRLPAELASHGARPAPGG